MSCHHAAENEMRRLILWGGATFYMSPIPSMPSIMISVVLRRIKMIRGKANISITPRGIKDHIPLSILEGLAKERESNFNGFDAYMCPNYNRLQTMEGGGTQN